MAKSNLSNYSNAINSLKNQNIPSSARSAIESELNRVMAQEKKQVAGINPNSKQAQNEIIKALSNNESNQNIINAMSNQITFKNGVIDKTKLESSVKELDELIASRKKLDLGKISTSANGAKNGDYVSGVKEEVFNNSTVEKRNDGTYAVKYGDEIIGFVTDEAIIKEQKVKNEKTDSKNNEKKEPITNTAGKNETEEYDANGFKKNKIGDKYKPITNSAGKYESDKYDANGFKKNKNELIDALKNTIALSPKNSGRSTTKIDDLKINMNDVINTAKYGEGYAARNIPNENKKNPPHELGIQIQKNHSSLVHTTKDIVDNRMNRPKSKPVKMDSAAEEAARKGKEYAKHAEMQPYMLNNNERVNVMNNTDYAMNKTHLKWDNILSEDSNLRNQYENIKENIQKAYDYNKMTLTDRELAYLIDKELSKELNKMKDNAKKNNSESTLTKIEEYEKELEKSHISLNTTEFNKKWDSISNNNFMMNRKKEIEKEIEKTYGNNITTAQKNGLMSEKLTKEFLTYYDRVKKTTNEELKQELKEIKKQAIGNDIQSIYSYSDNQMEIIYGTILHESGWTEDAIKPVAQVVYNRANIGYSGDHDPYSVLTHSGQFQSFEKGYWKGRLETVKKNPKQYEEFTEYINDILSGIEHYKNDQGYLHFSGNGSTNTFKK